MGGVSGGVVRVGYSEMVFRVSGIYRVWWRWCGSVGEWCRMWLCVWVGCVVSTVLSTATQARRISHNSELLTPITDYSTLTSKHSPPTHDILIITLAAIAHTHSSLFNSQLKSPLKSPLKSQHRFSLSIPQQSCLASQLLVTRPALSQVSSAISTLQAQHRVNRRQLCSAARLLEASVSVH